MKRLHYLWYLILLIALPVTAQEMCTTDIIRAFSRASAACDGVERNQACYGNGDLMASFDNRYQTDFALVGERVDTGLMQQLMLVSENDLSIAMMQLQMNLLNTQPGRNVSVLAFGDVQLINQVPVRPTIEVEATGVLIIRERPDIEADIVGEYPLRTSVTANGLYSEGGWLRVEVPDMSQIAWVSLDIIATNEDINTLNIVDVDSPFLRPFQQMQLETSSSAVLCDEVVNSGVLIQTPNVIDSVEMTINGIDILLSGTVFIQTNDDETIFKQLDGNTLLRSDTDSQWLVTGAMLQADTTVSDAIPFDPSELMGLPLNNLNYRVRMPAVISEADIIEQITALEAEPIMIAETSPMSPQRCSRSSARPVILYAGPGTFYEVIREIRTGTSLYPVLRLTDSEGVIWWQLSNGHWMLSSHAETEGACNEIPVTEIVAPPMNNTLILETCDTTNGPIREGQWVQVEFTAGSWRTLGEAQAASRIDPGSINVNQQGLYVHANSPQQVAEERFYRTFFATWYAEIGTYRIVGNRLSYSVICDITVPVG